MCLHVQVLAFGDVGLSGTLTIAVHDRHTLCADVLLGSVRPWTLRACHAPHALSGMV